MLISEMRTACYLIPSCLVAVSDANDRVIVRVNTHENVRGIIGALVETGIISLASGGRCRALLNWYMMECPSAINDLMASRRYRQSMREQEK